MWDFCVMWREKTSSQKTAPLSLVSSNARYFLYCQMGTEIVRELTLGTNIFLSFWICFRLQFWPLKLLIVSTVSGAAMPSENKRYWIKRVVEIWYLSILNTSQVDWSYSNTEKQKKRFKENYGTCITVFTFWSIKIGEKRSCRLIIGLLSQYSIQFKNTYSKLHATAACYRSLWCSTVRKYIRAKHVNKWFSLGCYSARHRNIYG